MANKLVSFPTEFFGGLFGNAAKKIKEREYKNEQAGKKAEKKQKKKGK